MQRHEAVDINAYPDFISDAGIERHLSMPVPDAAQVRAVIAKALRKEALSVAETAVLVAANTPELIEEIETAAKTLKERVYGNRIVIFAPLYIGNACINDCQYCGFRRSNKDARRITLQPKQIESEVLALENMGHKRLILVFGEHPSYDPECIAGVVNQVYGIKDGNGEIRRVNINAAPMDIEGYKTVRESNIGTYQIFQETYHKETYSAVHPANTPKGDYLYRLHGLSRAMEAGIDDVGIGALFGLHDWRYELLGLVAHAKYLQDKYGVGPHTVSFPRLQDALGMNVDMRWKVSESEFRRLVAILRLAIPYTGLILTARETADVRRDVLELGVSQIDAGSTVELGGYAKICGGVDDAASGREQFKLGDHRPLDEIMHELLQAGHVPSFCTACYRAGRTGEHFMEFAIPGFIKKYCTPNALMTLTEYLEDYASTATRAEGLKVVEDEMKKMEEGELKEKTAQSLENIRSGGKRDPYF